MKKNYKSINSHLYKLNYKFVEPEQDGMISMKYEDIIRILEITNDKIDLEIGRVMRFQPNVESTLEVVFKASLYISKPVSEEIIIKDLRSGIDMINVDVYSNISLLMAEILGKTFPNPLITPPAYNKTDVLIKK